MVEDSRNSLNMSMVEFYKSSLKMSMVEVSRNSLKMYMLSGVPVGNAASGRCSGLGLDYDAFPGKTGGRKKLANHKN